METEKFYYKIGEVAEMLGVNSSLIRFWEKEFPSLKPKKNRRGNRVFTADDIEELKKVYNLVKEQGHTLEGAKRILRYNKNPNAKIIEIEEKPIIPIGDLAANPSGELFEVNEVEYGKTSIRAIVDIGSLDISTDFLFPMDKEISIIGASSDMLVLDLGNRKNDYKVGNLIPFTLKYMGALGLLNSDYIEKKVV